PRPIPAPAQLPLDFPYFPLADLWLLAVFVVHRKNLSLIIGPPIQPKPGERASRLLNRLSRALYQMEKTARRAKIHSTETIHHTACSGAAFEEQLLDIAGRTGPSRDRLLSRARSLFREIAASMKGRAISVLNSLLTPIIRKAFLAVDVRGLEEM